MKILGVILTVVSLLHCVAGYTADSETPEPDGSGTWKMDDPSWLKENADKLAECVGTYRAGAWLMRSGGREESANYLEDLARGAYLVSTLLLTHRADLQGKVLYGEDSSEYVEVLAHGKEGQLKMAIESTGGQDTPLLDEAFSVCNGLNELQAAIIKSMRESKLNQ